MHSQIDEQRNTYLNQKQEHEKAVSGMAIYLGYNVQMALLFFTELLSLQAATQDELESIRLQIDQTSAMLKL